MSSKRRSGFTLLEVLASVAILGIVYTMLSGVAARWLGAEGEARRRMLATLHADRALAEIEAQVAAGTLPPPGENETQDENEIYRVLTRVQDFPIPVEICASLEEKRPAKAPTLCGAAPGGPSYLRRIDVVVGWEESGQPLEVQRSTLAFDYLAAAPVLAAIPRSDGAGGAQAGAPDADAGDATPAGEAQRQSGQRSGQKKSSFGGSEPPTPVTQGRRGEQQTIAPEEQE